MEFHTQGGVPRGAGLTLGLIIQPFQGLTR